jgi:hypothetical protein
MAWITITDAAILGKSAGAEVDAARSAALAIGQTDPVPGLVEQIVREVRGYVAACKDNKLGPAGTIPDELLGAALNRLRFECATRLPGGALLDEDRRAANRDAIAMLRDAGACRIVLEQPDTPSTEILASQPSPRWKARGPQFSRRQQDGA